MRYRRGSLLGTALVVLGGCAMLGGQPAGRVAGNTYVNAEESLAFRIPSGWSAVESRNPFRRPDFVARFQPPEENASVTARSIAVGSSACIDAARDALTAEGLAVSSEQPFVIDTPAGQAPAWRGEVRSSEGDRRGRASLFCTGGRAVLLVALAETGAYQRYADEISRTIQSFAYAGGPTIVQVAPPPTPIPVRYFEHVVEWRGQTLGQIARWYTGAYDNWKKLT
ncbi:MAG: hypothetical protein ACREQY_23835, partial [Candidatus Binatia bacterium]